MPRSTAPLSLLTVVLLAGCADSTDTTSAEPEAANLDDHTLGAITISDETGTEIESGAQDIVASHLELGAPVEYALITQTIDELKSHYQAEGYEYVNVIPKTAQDDERKTLEVHFVIQRGPGAAEE